MQGAIQKNCLLIISGGSRNDVLLPVYLCQNVVTLIVRIRETIPVCSQDNSMINYLPVFSLNFRKTKAMALRRSSWVKPTRPITTAVTNRVSRNPPACPQKVVHANDL